MGAVAEDLAGGTRSIAGPAVAVMAKVPAPGRVKTRLAGAIGDALACELSRCFIRDLDARLVALELPTFWFQWPPGRSIGALAPHAAGVLPQQGDDLGARMEHALARLFEMKHGPVVLLGSDVPHVPLCRIHEAIDMVGTGIDVVLGPARDGGYYLIALDRPVPVLFRDLPWGGRTLFRDTARRARRDGLRLEALPPCFDVDTAPDLERLARLLDAPGACTLPRTKAVLASLRRQDLVRGGRT
jgi:hypothetical protein